MVRTMALMIFTCLSTYALAAETTSAEKKGKPHPALTDPSQATEKAPEEFQVKVETTKGDFLLVVKRKWSPNGADRFYNLIQIGYFKDIAIFRAIEGFMFQFGIHGDPKISDKWAEANIKDDPDAGISNRKGFITYAKSGRPHSRSTQFFINLGNNGSLDRDGFTPFGEVTKGIEVIDKINTEYGENPRDVQSSFKANGNEYIKRRFPNIDFIKSMSLVKEKQK